MNGSINSTYLQHGSGTEFASHEIQNNSDNHCFSPERKKDQLETRTVYKVITQKNKKNLKIELNFKSKWKLRTPGL